MRAVGLILIASLAACSGKSASGDNAAASNTASAASGASSQASAKDIRDKFVAQCVSQAQATTPIKVDFTPICACSADKLLATKTPAELMKGVSATDAQAVAAACAREHPITLPAKS